VSLLLLPRALWLRRQLRRRQRWPRERVLAYQARALAALRTFAVERSRFYARRYSGLRDRPLDELPMVTKRDLLEHFDEVVTVPGLRRADVEAALPALAGDALLNGRYRITTTSGTTGARGLFVQGPAEWAHVIASYARANEWAGIAAGLTRRVKLAVVASRAAWHQSARVGASVAGRWVDALRLDAAEDALPDVVARLNAFGPENLTAYASMADLLAQEQLEGRLRIRPRAVMVSSEVLTAAARRRIAEAWGAEPYEVYAATETAGIAAECERHEGMHLFEDLVITEVVDDRNRPVPPGEFGAKILVTVLFSRTQPLIRYELSDSVRLTERRCSCGRPFRLVEAVQGRQEDTLRFDGGARGPATVHPNVLHRALEAMPVRAWQVRQREDGLEVLVVDPAPGFDASRVERAVGAELARVGVDPVPRVSLKQVAHIPRGAAGKAPLIVALRRPR
jgi:phenylacetate-CoA ligase